VAGAEAAIRGLTRGPGRTYTGHLISLAVRPLQAGTKRHPNGPTELPGHWRRVVLDRSKQVAKGGFISPLRIVTPGSAPPPGAGPVPLRGA
jgi:hypothetical protein